MTSKDIWKDIPGWEGYYQASKFGEIKGVTRFVGNRNVKGKVLSQKLRKDNYLQVNLCKEGSYESFLVHRLIAKTFLEDSGKSQVNHIDFNTRNNKLENLEWVTSYENMKHSGNHGRLSKFGTENHQAKFTENDLIIIKELKKQGLGGRRIRNTFYPHVTHTTINRAAKGITYV